VYIDKFITMVLITNNRKIGDFNNTRLIFSETELNMTDQVKYLGVISDKKLDWNPHLEDMISYWW
jgi:hypothetical protein